MGDILPVCALPRYGVAAYLYPCTLGTIPLGHLYPWGDICTGVTNAEIVPDVQVYKYPATPAKHTTLYNACGTYADESLRLNYSSDYSNVPVIFAVVLVRLPSLH